MTEPTSIDVQGSDTDGRIERPRTPRTFSRVSSFNKSFSGDPDEGSENGSPFLNQFTTVSKGYGKSLIHPTSPTRVRAPRPVSTPSPTLGPKQLDTRGHHMEMHPPTQAPSSPTKRKSQTGTGDESSQGGTAGGVESTGIGDDNAGVSVNPGPSRGLRSSKRAREDRDGGTKTHEQPGSGGTPNKRNKV